MKLIFCDEICGSAIKNLFGVCLVVIDCSKYNAVYSSFYKTLQKVNWPLTEEFKGKYLFSTNPANTDKKPEDLIELTELIINHLSSKSKSRCEVIFAYNRNGQSSNNYIRLLESAILKIKKSTSNSLGKNLASITIDNFEGLGKPELKRELNKRCFESLIIRKYLLVESNVGIVFSSNLSVGVCYADIISYISKWVIENPKKQQKCGQISLFELYDDEESRSEVQLKKINKTHELAEMIKNIKFLEISNI